MKCMKMQKMSSQNSNSEKLELLSFFCWGEFGIIVLLYFAQKEENNKPNFLFDQEVEIFSAHESHHELK